MRADRREDFYDEALKRIAGEWHGFDLTAGEASLNLALTYDVLHSHFARAMCRFGLAKSTYNVLMLLRHGPAGGMQLSDIGELLITSRANVTGLIDHLEQKGYVKRVVDAHDRRARLARITKKGEAVIETVIPLHNRQSAELFAHLTDREKASLVGLLKKVRQSPALSQVAAEAAVEELAGVPGLGE